MVLVADFVDPAGESAFSRALRDALSIKLDQSTHLRSFSDEYIRQNLRLMGRSPDEPVTGQVAREVCRRGTTLPPAQKSAASEPKAVVYGCWLSR